MTFDPIRFHVSGVPVAQPRPRPFGGGRYGVPEEHPVHAWRDGVALAFRQTARREWVGGGPLSMHVEFVMPRPKSKVWRRKPMPRYPHTAVPDGSNLLKAVEDALNGVAYGDDSTIARGTFEKWVAAGDEKPGALVTISNLGDGQ